MDSQHKTLNISGVGVTFPFEPYDIQRRYMEKVIKAVQTSQNALLESPTGTGKTLSLLCSSVAWQQNEAPVGTKIYYTSRTHLQLNQAAKEMKRTAYARVPSVVMASRTHLCLNDDVKGHEDQSISRACQNATKRNACSYFNHFEQKLDANLDPNKVTDIEDLLSFGRSHECCPYYASKKIAETHASVIFMPYNYLIDLSIQKSVQIKIDKSVLIIDEGHNIESALKDSASGHFTKKYLTIIQESCHELPSKLSQVLTWEQHGLDRSRYDPTKKRTRNSNNNNSNPDKDKAEDKVNPIEELAEKLTNDRLQKVNKCATSLLTCEGLFNFKKTFEGTKISIKSVYGKLQEAGVVFSSADALMETLDCMATFWSIAGVMRPDVIARYMCAITNLSKFISLMFPAGFLTKEKFDKHVSGLEEFYSAYLEGEYDESPVFITKKMVGWTMHMWCLHPKLGLERVLDSTSVMGPRSLIITSGTLAPMKQMQEELGREFKYLEEFEHLILAKQFKISLLGRSPKGYSLLSTYEDSKKPEYMREIGQTILALFQVLPFGTLVFFPSYALMNRVTNYWERSCPQIWNQMRKATKIFREPKDQAKFCDEMINFKRTIDHGGRAAFVAVCRGKLSEGTNLEANHCRNVIIIGLPFPSYTDPRIQETIALHRKRGDDRGAWYQLQMKRALGQAIGRVIRSKDDFGMLFLCDPRFAQFGLSLSKWIHQFYPKYPTDDYRQLNQDVRGFYEAHNIDISSAVNMSDMGSFGQNSAFEFERTTKSIALVSPLSNNTTASSAINVRGSQNRSGNTNQNHDDDDDDHNQPEKPIDRVAKMLQSYTVDRETYRRVQGNRRPAQPEADKIAETKRPRKTTGGVFESLFSQQQQEPSQGDTTAVPSNSETPTAVIHIDDNDEPAATSRETNGTIDQTNTEHVPAATGNVGPEPLASKSSSSTTTATTSSKTTAGPAKARPESICYICKNNAIRPHVINCPCARLGCYSCLKGLNNKECGVCKTKLKVKRFKQKLFNVFQRREIS